MNKLAPSILSADFWKLGEQIRQLENAGADLLHIDVMDGMFVPSISFGIPVIQTIRKETNMFFDCHLMIEDPQRYIEAFAKAGADSITVHYEACSDLKKTLTAIHELGIKTGISINPETPVQVLAPYLEYADMILIMSVHPGFGGQKFIEDSLEKLAEVKKMVSDSGLCIDIEVDGGINKDNLKVVLEAGANVIVSGNSVFKGNIEENVVSFRKLMGRS